MTKVRMLAPWTNEKGEPYAAGAVVDLDDETVTALSNRGMVSKLDDEKALEDQQQKEGVYNASLTRDKVQGSAPPTAPPPADIPATRPAPPPQNPPAKK